jgi:hypothetical protein
MQPAPAILLALLLSGCGWRDIRLNRQVSSEEVIGIWTMTEDSFQNISNYSDATDLEGAHGDYQIEIRKDGGLRYRSVFMMQTRAVDYQGTWKLNPRIDMPGANELEIQVEANGGHGLSLDFTEEDGRLLLWTYFGDPDSWCLEKYEKVPNKAEHADR